MKKLSVALILAMASLAPAIAHAQDKVTIRVGTHISIAAHLIMQKKPEILKNLGKTYDIQWVRFSGGGDAAPALAAGKIDGCLGTPFPLTNVLFRSRVPVTIVHQLLSFGVDGYYDDTTVVKADSGINSVADLKGKVAGVNAIGSTSEQNLRIMARKAGLKDDDITVVEGRPPFLPQMLHDNKVQAVTLFQPFYKKATSGGNIKTLFRSSDAYGSPTDYVFMMFADSFLKAHPQAVRDYVADYLLAVNWALDNRAEAVSIYATQYKLPLEVVDGYLLTKEDYLVRRDGKVSAKLIQPALDALYANKFIDQNFDVNKYIDASYLPK
ncbi:MAG: ABC transporter substrate-binding protein [Pseudorhodoplanes sp.]|uniref:ABC transporter substrate-binding protein n=1 Tax=Pseudorhodoplanes sp. TaxID=1934341 RepID=UPI003D0A486E